MKKLLLLLTLLVTAVGYAFADTWTSAPTTAGGWDAILEGSSSSNTKAPTKWTDTSNNVEVAWAMTYDWEGTVYYSRGKSGLQFGAGSNRACKELKLTTSSFNGTITKVTVKGAKTNGSNGTIKVTVGGATFGSSASVNNTAADKSFTGSASGEIIISFTQTANSKNICLTGLEVEYTPGAGGDETKLGTPTINYVLDGATQPVGANAIVETKVGAEFTFACENAENITVTLGGAQIVNANAASANWTATLCASQPVVATFTRGTETKTFNFTLSAESTASSDDLGDIVVKYGDVLIPNTLDDADAAPFELPLGAQVTVSCTNATVLQMQYGDGDDFKYEENISNPYTLTFDKVGDKIPVTFIASRVDQDSQTKTFFFNAKVFKPAAGNIVGVYGEKNTSISNDEEITVEIDTEFTFTSEGATKIWVETMDEDLNVEKVASAEGNTVKWTPTTVFANLYVVVTASIGDDTDTANGMGFFLSTTKPVAGDIVITYGNDNKVFNAEDELLLTVDKGTKITISSANATYVEASAIVDDDVVTFGLNENGNTISWTADNLMEEVEVNVHARIGNDADTKKELEFLLTVVEPVVPEGRKFTRVTSLDQLIEGRNYIIAAEKEIDEVNTTFVMGSKPNNNNIPPAATTFVPSDVITIDANATEFMILVLGKEDVNGKTSYYFSDGGTPTEVLYLNPGNGTSNNRLYFTHQTKISDALFEPTFNDGTLNIKFTCKEKRNNLGFLVDTNGKYFNCYNETTSFAAPILYVEEVAELEAPEVPTFDLMEEDATKVAVVAAAKGELHVKTTEYDAQGKEVTPAAAPLMAETAEPWTNKVEPVDGRHVIALPTTKGNVIKIQAKTVLNGLHSAEMVQRVTSEGKTIAGIEAVEADNADAPAEYFNLQGQRVDGTVPGIYLVRRGNEVSKVIVR